MLRPDALQRENQLQRVWRHFTDLRSVLFAGPKSQNKPAAVPIKVRTEGEEITISDERIVTFNLPDGNVIRVAIRDNSLRVDGSEGITASSMAKSLIFISTTRPDTQT